MKTSRKLNVLLTFLIMGWAGSAWAVDVSGNVDAQTISANTTWNVTGTVNLRGRITIESGATLTIQPNSTADANRVIRRRNNWDGMMFYVKDGGSLVVKSRTVNGTVYKMYFDGGATFTNNDARTYNGTGTAPSNYGTGIIIRADGNLTMTNAVVRNGYNPGSGAGIRCYNTSNTARTFSLTGVTIQACWAKDGSAVYFGGVDYHNATMTNCIVEKCNAISDAKEGGSIRTNGGVKTSLTLSGCTILIGQIARVVAFIGTLLAWLPPRLSSKTTRKFTEMQQSLMAVAFSLNRVWIYNPLRFTAIPRN